MKNLIIMGMKHTGKSTQGRRLASFYDMTFLDLDDVIVEGYPEKDMSLREIYKKEGREGFLKLEQEGAKACAKRLSRDGNVVLSLGGGTIDNRQAMKVLEHQAYSIHLLDSADTLYKRISLNGIPPFLDKEDPYQSFLDIYNRRTKLYSEWANMTIDLNNKNQDQAFDIINRSIQEYNNAR